MHYIVWLLSLTVVLASCEKYEPDLYEEEANGAYFDYGYAADFDKTVNFSDYIVGKPDTVSITLRVKLLGYLQSEARTLAVKTKALEGYKLADVFIPDVVFANNDYEKDIEVKVIRPEKEDSIYGVCIYLDGSGDIGTGIKGKDAVNLYVTESYGMPSVWYSHMDTYLGGWTKEKHIYLAEHTGDNHFYDKLYDNESGLHLYDSIISLNVSAVNALLADEPATPIVVDLPILKEGDYPAYTKPYFWDDYEEYLGLFRAGKFCRFTTMIGGSDTQRILDLYASEESRQKMEEEAVEFHKSDVHEMLKEYNLYAQQGIAIAEYRELFWVEMRDAVTYTMVVPFWWEDPQGLGTAEIVKKYFGDYSDEKYQFMLKTMMSKEGADNFVAASILPFIYDREKNAYAWDQSPLGGNLLIGEERLKECYRIIRAENNNWPPSLRFDIPNVSLD